MKRLSLFWSLFALGLSAQAPDNTLFETKIRPVLATKCYVCHSSSMPSPFTPTDADRLFPVGLCEDTHGDLFRTGRYWTRGCERVCPDGFGDTCGAGGDLNASLVRCYHETRFTITLDDIERGALIPSGSLALGNFNYRLDSLGVNLVAPFYHGFHYRLWEVSYSLPVERVKRLHALRYLFGS